MKITQHFTGVFKYRDTALFMLGVLTGFRISELLAVRSGWLVSYPSKVKPRLKIPARFTKDNRSKSNPVPKDYKIWLLPWLDHMHSLGFTKSSDYLFSGFNRQPIDRITYLRILKGAALRAGVHPNMHGTIGTHSMRKTFCSNSFKKFGEKDAKNALLMTQKAMKHASVASTQKYLPDLQEDIDNGILDWCNDLLTDLQHNLSKPN